MELATHPLLAHLHPKYVFTAQS